MRIFGTVVVAVSLMLMAAPVHAKKVKSPPGESAPVEKKAKPEPPECAACTKEASRLFATGKTTDALKLLRANQVNCKDSSRFNLLLSTILLRMPSHEKEAAQAAANAVEADPSSVPANFQLGICLMAAGETEKAIGVYEDVVKLDPANYEAWSALGQLYGDMHNGAKSKACAAKAAILEPNSRTAKIRTAQNLFKQGNPEAVKAELDRLITDDHMEPEFFVGLCEDALDMQSYDEAIRAADRALAAYPKLASVIRTKAKAQLWKRQYSEGLDTISQIESRTASDTDALAVRIVLLIKLGKTSDAQLLARKLPANASDAPLPALAKGYLAERNGDTSEAIKQFDYSLRKNQMFAPAHVELARLYLRLGKTDDVISETEEIERSKPFASASKAFESRMALEEAPKRDKVELALKLAREAVKLDGDDPEALTALAMSELKGGKLESTKSLITKALTIEPGNVDAMLVDAKLLEGNSSKRLQALQKISATAPGDSEVLAALSQAYIDSGDISAAINLLRERVDNDADPIVVFALARAYERSGRAKEAAKFFKQSLTEGLSGQRASLARDALKSLGNNPPEEL